MVLIVPRRRQVNQKQAPLQEIALKSLAKALACLELEIVRNSHGRRTSPVGYNRRERLDVCVLTLEGLCGNIPTGDDDVISSEPAVPTIHCRRQYNVLITERRFKTKRGE